MTDMVYVFLADVFEEIEAIGIIDILRRANIDVATVGVSAKAVRGSHGIEVIADVLADEITPDERLEAVALPGGMPGMINLDKSLKVHEFLDYANNTGKLCAAICAAPSVLGHSGILEGREATCYPGFESELKGASLSDEYVVQSGNVITGRGPGVTTDFAFKMVEYLAGEETAEDIRKGMQCRK